MASTVEQQNQDFQINSIDEFCPVHNIEYVAFDQETGETLCNCCIFDKPYKSLVFNATLAKKLKDLYDEKFTEYKNSLEKLKDLTGDMFAKQFHESMNTFFNSLKEHLAKTKSIVLDKVRQSKNLKDIESILQSVESSFDQNKAIQYRQEKSRFDTQISQGRFAQIWAAKSYYDQIIRWLDYDSDRLEKAWKESDTKLDKILKIKKDNKLVVRKMNEIVDNCMEIDPGMIQEQKQIIPQTIVQQRPNILPQLHSFNFTAQRTGVQFANPNMPKSSQQSAFTPVQIPKPTEPQKTIEIIQAPKPTQVLPPRPQIPKIQSSTIQTTTNQELPPSRDTSSKLKINLTNSSSIFPQSCPQNLNKDIREELCLKPSSPIKSSFTMPPQPQTLPPAPKIQTQPYIPQPQIQPPTLQPQIHHHTLQPQIQPFSLQPQIHHSTPQSQIQPSAAHPFSLSLESPCNPYSRPTQPFSQASQAPSQFSLVFGQNTRETFCHTNQQSAPMETPLEKYEEIKEERKDVQMQAAEENLQQEVKAQEEMKEQQKESEVRREEQKEERIMESKDEQKSFEREELKEECKEELKNGEREGGYVDFREERKEDEKVENFEVRVELNDRKVEEDKKQESFEAQNQVQKTENMVNVEAAPQEIQTDNFMESYLKAMRMNQMEEPEKSEVTIEKPQSSNPQSFIDRLNSYDCFYKMKAMSIYKVTEEGELTKLYSLKDLFLPKNVFTTDQKVYVIGGSKELNVIQTVNVCLEIDFKNSIIRPTEKAPMLDSRASFGCTISKDESKIFVAGGYKNSNEVFEKCEMYNIKENRWYPLPDLSKAKCSSGLCEFTSNGKTWLYCLGGLWRSANSKEVWLLDEIERIELWDNMENGWEILPLTLPEKICDIGVNQLNEKTIMICGGWSINSISGVHYFEPESERMTIKSENGANEMLAKSDFFLVNGCVGKSKDGKVLISGHHYLHKFDPATKQFLALGAD